MSSLVRPLSTRLAQARDALAGFPVAPEPLRYSLSADVLAEREPEVDVDVLVREQVIREALSEALAYHCPDAHCPHLTDPRSPSFAVFARAEILCPLCSRYEIDEHGEHVREDEAEGFEFLGQVVHHHPLKRADEWQAPEWGDCTLCGLLADPFLPIWTTSGAMGFVTHVCAVCASWWPYREPAPEPEPFAGHAEVTSFWTSHPIREPTTE